MDHPLPMFVAVAGSMLVLFIIFRVVYRKRPAPLAPTPLRIDVAALGETGPPSRGPVLECYNVPVRLAAVVLAPVGRAPLPAPEELGGVLEALTPGLRSVFVGHGTKVYQWPSQLSPRGFGRSLFAEAPLPGDHGRGTPWCALAGRIDSADRPLMIGFLLCAAAPNALGQILVDSPGKWLDILRVRA